ncbi:hypothetical protein H4R35_000973, partial [Dimargaris xerosporica]
MATLGVNRPSLSAFRHPQLPTSDWRTAFLAGDNASQAELKTARLDLPDRAHFTTSVAASQTAPLVAIGSGGTSSNLFVVKARAASLETDDGTLPSAELKAQASVRYPIHSLSFANQHIVTGNDRGTNMLYALDPQALVTSQDESPVDVGKSLRMVATFRNKLSRTLETPVPGRYIASRRVLCTDFEPISSPSSSTDANTAASSPRFLSAAGPIVHIWDINDTKAPIRDDRISHFQQTTGSWNPYPFSQLIALGGVDKQLTVIDIRKRGKPMVWKAKDAHRAPITDVKWSPFVPYWLASAGDDHN